MDFNLNSDQQMLRQTLRQIAQKELAPRAANIDRTSAFPAEGLAKRAASGVLGLTLPAAVGGGGANSVSFVLAVEEVAKACASTALVFVTHAVASLGVLIGGEADLYLPVVRTSDPPGPAGLSLLAVEKDSPGLSMGRKDDRMGLNGSSPREIVFQDCAVPVENLLGAEGGFMPLGMAMGGLGALGAAAMALGLSEAALEASISHARSRVVLKQPIGAYQGIQFLVSEMAAAVDAMRAHVYYEIGRAS